MIAHPELAMTICEAYTAWPEHFREVQSKATRRLRLWQWQWWEKYSGNPPIGDITRKTFIDFRTRAMADGLAVPTVEGTINSVIAVLNEGRRQKVILEMPERPKKLRAAPTKAPAATIGEFSRFTEFASKSMTPKMHSAVTDRRPFWRAFCGVFYFTGLRRFDVEQLRWSNIGPDEITVCAEKTGKVQIIPLHPVLRLLLEAWRPQSGRERIFPHCRVTTMRIFHKLRNKAGAPTICPQAIRKLAARQYEQAHGGAGAIILGHAIPGATIYYLSAVEILRKAQTALAVPDCFRDCVPSKSGSDLASIVESLPEAMQGVLRLMIEQMRGAKGGVA